MKNSFYLLSALISIGFLFSFGLFDIPILQQNMDYIFQTQRVKKGVYIENSCAFTGYQAHYKAHLSDYLIMGSSSPRESHWEDQHLEHAFFQKTKKKVNICKLTSTAQTPIESFFLASLIKWQANQTLFLYIGPGTFIRKERAIKRINRGLFLTTANDFLSKYFKTNPWAKELKINYIGDWSRQIKVNQVKIFRAIFNFIHLNSLTYLFGLPTYKFSSFNKIYVNDTSKNKERMDYSIKTSADKFNQRWPKYQKNNFEILIKMLDYLKAKKVNVIVCRTAFLNSPVYFEHYNANYLKKYEGHLEKLVKKSGNPLMNINQNIKMTYADFFDALHVSPQGRDKWSKEFINVISKKNIN